MLTIFFYFLNWPPPPLVPCTKMVYNTTPYFDKHNICKQMSIILLLTDVFFLQNYIDPNNLFFGGCMAAKTLCIISVVS